MAKFWRDRFCQGLDAGREWRIRQGKQSRSRVWRFLFKIRDTMTTIIYIMRMIAQISAMIHFMQYGTGFVSKSKKGRKKACR